MVSEGTKVAAMYLREWSSTVSRRVCLVSAFHQGWMEESCCQSSPMRARCQRRRGLAMGAADWIRPGKWVRTWAAMDFRSRRKPHRPKSSSARSWKLGGL